MSSRGSSRKLHQVGIERRDSALQCSRQTLHHAQSAIGDLLSDLAVRQPRPDANRQLAGVRHEFSAAGAIERLINLGEIPDMRPVHHGGAKLRGLDRILAAMLDQRTAHEDDRRQPIDQAKLAQRIRHVNLNARFGNFAKRPLRHLQACAASDTGDAVATLWMARHQDCQKPRKGPPQPAVHLDQLLFLARMRRSSGNQQPRQHRGLKLPQRLGIERRSGNIELEIARGAVAWRAKLGVAVGILGGLREAKIKTAQERADRSRELPPAFERPLGQSPVGSGSGEMSPQRQGHDQVRPESDSTNSARFGFQWLRKRVANFGTSTGTN